MEMPMTGGWQMSMMWMRMPGQTWPGAAASFLGMWILMMVPMMLPSLIPMLRAYRHAIVQTGDRRWGELITIVAAGYFVVWAAFGLMVFPIGATLAAIEMQQAMLARAVPSAAAIVVLITGALQFSDWKARCLSCCGESSGLTATPDRVGAWKEGVRLGRDCVRCCANLMTILLVIGVMDLRAMVFVSAAITLERLAPTRVRAARVIGGAIVAGGLLQFTRAAGIV